MSYLSNGQLAQEGDFKLIVKIALVSAAKDNAAAAETNFVAYQKRHGYAVQVLNDPDAKVNAFAFAVAANPAIEKESTDADIQFTVNSMFNLMSGVIPSDETTEVNTGP